MAAKRLSSLNMRLMDARPDRLDLRDRPYMPRVSSLPAAYPDPSDAKKFLPDYLESGLILDQGQDGACTGFGLAAVVNYLLWMRQIAQTAKNAKRSIDRVSPRMLYHLAKFYDEWEGEDYEGSSCRGALKAWHKHGACKADLWPYDVDPRHRTAPRFQPPREGWQLDAVRRPLGVYYRIDKSSVVDIQAAICEVGAVYVSADVHAGWQAVKPAASFKGYDKLPVIAMPRTRQFETGGHAFSLVGYTDTGFVVQNSWGAAWGTLGFALLPYEDWVQHGTDAWAVSLGVPIVASAGGKAEKSAVKSPNYFFKRREASYLAGVPMGMFGSPQDRFSHGYFKPFETGDAYAHTLVAGNNGGLVNRLVECADATASAEQICYPYPAFTTGSLQQQAAARVVLYVHGGLNSESAALERNRVLAPYFAENGLHPIFVAWKTGPLEVICDRVKDAAGEVLGDAAKGGLADDLRRAARRVRDKVIESTDRALEVAAQSSGGRAMWIEMKQNALAATAPGRAIDVMATQFAQLAKALTSQGKPFELHLMGHSAGAIMLGHLLTALAARKQAVASCQLFAPACTTAFAVQHYLAACEAKILPREQFHISVLSDERELNDSVGPYQKSLLYLVSRAFEDAHKTPLLGLLKSFDPACNTEEHWVEEEFRHEQLVPGSSPTLANLKRWQSFWWGQHAQPQGFAQKGAVFDRLHVFDASQADNGRRKLSCGHGCFDNDVATMRASIARIRGVAPGDVLPAAGRWNLDY